MNLAVLRKSRPTLRTGDIFVMRPPVGGYLFGRVIELNTKIFDVGCWILIYIYDARSDQKRQIPELRRDRLLVPPVITNRLPWTRGYFEQLEHRNMVVSDRLPQHCFKNSWGQYFDETGRRLPGPTEPVGVWGLSSFRAIDESISKALGIPLSVDDEPVKPVKPVKPRKT